MPYLFLLTLIAAYFYSQKSDAERLLNMKDKRLFDLEDIESENQGGKYTREYDLSFEKAADLTGVPFALIKAHSIRESSLNPKAFMDENPGKRADRVGWASRGLMQVLWWPKSERFKNYGYPDSALNNGEKLFEPDLSAIIGAKIMADNLRSCKGNLRDAINMYNTGKKEAVFKAPHGYVDKVLDYYNILIRKV